MSILLEHFNAMIENPTPVNKFEFNALLKESSYEEVLEVSSDLMIYEPAVDMLKGLYESSHMQLKDVQKEIEKIKVVRESIYPLEQLTGIYNKLTDCLEGLQRSFELRNSDEYLLETTLLDFKSKENVVKESIQNYVVTESYEVNGPDEAFLRSLESLTANQFAIKLIELTKAQSNNEVVKALESMMHLAATHSDVKNDQLLYVGESIKDKARKTAIKADEASRNAYNKVRKGASETKRVTTIAGKATGRFTNLVADTIDKIREMDAGVRREAIIRGGIQRKVIKLLRTAVTTGALALLSPIAAGIHLITSVALDVRTDKRVKDALMTDLQNELKIVKEKVRDADNNGDKQAKYKLMRLESTLEKEIQRIESGNRNIEPMNYRKLRNETK